MKYKSFIGSFLFVTAGAYGDSCCLMDFVGSCVDVADETACDGIGGCFMGATACENADCDATAGCVGGSFGAVFADSGLPVGFDPIPPGTEIQYRATLTMPLETCLTLVGGDLTITFPDGTQEKVIDDHGPFNGCNSIVAFSNIYTTSLDDINSSGHLRAFFDYGRSIRVDQDGPMFLNGPPLEDVAGVNLALPTNLIGAAASCLPEDISRDDIVGIEDLLNTIVHWDEVIPAMDTDLDGVANVNDLIKIIIGWGTCGGAASETPNPILRPNNGWTVDFTKEFDPVLLN